MSAAMQESSTEVGTADELVVLLDDAGRPIGTAPKRTVHHGDTPLHLAFSCWVFDDAGRTLLTRRASTKITWPDVWTNTVCGHPAPDEAIESAVERRARQELGVTVLEVEPLLPDFRYRAVMSDGTVENEVCPVYRARIEDPVRPDPTEVSASQWWSLRELRAAVTEEPTQFSPWMCWQLEQLDQLDRLHRPGRLGQPGAPAAR